ncbi:hypothetical protein SUGI_0859460 [Cryptomeria japonica]|nr:hypothetical protein SUGI_0859460 [Cryptomeria japonica]
MVDANDNAAKIVDFGLSKHVDWEGTHRITGMIENNRFEEAVDLKLKKDGWDIFAVEEALAVANIGLRCAHSEKVERPDMNLVVTQLTSTMSSGISSRQREEDIVPIEDVTSSQN